MKFEPRASPALSYTSARVRTHGRLVRKAHARTRARMGVYGRQQQAPVFLHGLVHYPLTRSRCPCDACRQRKQAIKMGQAAAYDFKLLLPMLCLGALGLTAACKFGGADSPTQSGDRAAPKMKLGGG